MDGKLTYFQIEQLQSTGLDNTYCRGFNLGNKEDNWMNYYELVKNYDHDKNVYKISINGYKEEKSLVSRWLATQRAYYRSGTLSIQRKKLLDPYIRYWDFSEKNEYTEKMEKEYELKRVQQIMEDYLSGIITLEIHGLKENPNTGMLIQTMAECDFYECEILLSGLLSEEDIRKYVSRYKKELVMYAKEKTIADFGEMHHVKVNNLNVDKFRCGTKSKVVSIMLSVHL